MRLLVTGAGMIGAGAANALADAGHAVTVLDIADPPPRLKAEFVRTDLREALRESAARTAG